MKENRRFTLSKKGQDYMDRISEIFGVLEPEMSYRTENEIAKDFAKVPKKVATEETKIEEIRRELLEWSRQLLERNEKLERPEDCSRLNWKQDAMNVSALNSRYIDLLVNRFENLRDEFIYAVHLINMLDQKITEDERIQENRRLVIMSVKGFLDNRPKEEDGLPILVSTEAADEIDQYYVDNYFWKDLNKKLECNGICSIGSMLVFDPNKVSIEEAAKNLSCDYEVEKIETFK